MGQTQVSQCNRGRLHQPADRRRSLPRFRMVGAELAAIHCNPACPNICKNCFCVRMSSGLCHQFTVAVIYEAFRNTLNLKEVIDLFCRDQAARDRIRNLSLKSILPLIIESGCIRTCRSCKRFTHVPLNNTARFGACTTDVLYYRRYARPQCARAMHICHFGPLPEIR